MRTIELPLSAGDFGRSFRSCMKATGQDASRPAIYRTIEMGIYKSGLRLTSTNSYFIVTVWCPFTEDDSKQPDIATDPDETYILADPDNDLTAFLGRVCKLDAAKDQQVPPTLTAKHRKIRPGSQLQLFATDTHEIEFSLNNGDQIVCCVVMEDIDFPNWRPLIPESIASTPGGLPSFQQTYNNLMTLSDVVSTFCDEDSVVVFARDDPKMFFDCEGYTAGSPSLKGMYMLHRSLHTDAESVVIDEEFIDKVNEAIKDTGAEASAADV